MKKKNELRCGFCGNKLDNVDFQFVDNGFTDQERKRLEKIKRERDIVNSCRDCSIDVLLLTVLQ